MTFLNELVCLINRYSRENASNTPDFILAQYIDGCLLAFETAVQQRETWYGRDAAPTMVEKPRMTARELMDASPEARDKYMREAADQVAKDYEPGGPLHGI
jgi:hypothetical protein